MEALTLTKSIVETGFKVKNSIDTFARRRSHARNLASDVVADLRRIEGFLEKNQSALSEDESLGQLRDSLDVLKSDLYRVHKRCQIYEPRKNDTKYKRLVSVVKLWMESDEIEANLVRIKERIQTSMNCLSLLSNGRVEVRVAKMEGILVNMYQGRRRIQQFDSVFTQELLHGDPGLGAFDRPSSELDNLDIQYIRLKALKLIDTISMATLTTKVTMFSRSLIYAFLPVVQPAPHKIISRTAELQELVTSEAICITDLSESILDIVEMLGHSRMMDIADRILGAVENRLRRTLRLGTRSIQLPCHTTEEEEECLDYLETILHYRDNYTLHYECDQSTACSIYDEDVKRASESIQFSRSRLQRRASPSNYHRMRFMNTLMPSISYHTIRGQVEECFSYCAEALEVIQPCIASTTHKKDIIHAGALQSQADIFWWLAFAQARDCDYTSAYRTGMDCMNSVAALSNIDKSLLPDNINYFDFILEHFQEAMPTWTSVVRNPENRRASYIEEWIDEDDVCDGSQG